MRSVLAIVLKIQVLWLRVLTVLLMLALVLAHGTDGSSVAAESSAGTAQGGVGESENDIVDGEDANDGTVRTTSREIIEHIIDLAESGRRCRGAANMLSDIGWPSSCVGVKTLTLRSISKKSLVFRGIRQRTAMAEIYMIKA